jgi:hypothetical protein
MEPFPYTNLNSKQDYITLINQLYYKCYINQRKQEENLKSEELSNLEDDLYSTNNLIEDILINYAERYGIFKKGTHVRINNPDTCKYRKIVTLETILEVVDVKSETILDSYMEYDKIRYIRILYETHTVKKVYEGEVHWLERITEDNLTSSDNK